LSPRHHRKILAEHLPADQKSRTFSLQTRQSSYRPSILRRRGAGRVDEDIRVDKTGLPAMIAVHVVAAERDAAVPRDVVGRQLADA
jgi:hypothetical protein